MYYPYLRGLQFELIALRELSQENNLLSFICPIIEPVRESLNSLALAENRIMDTGWHPYLILNPSVGDLVGRSDVLLDFYLDEKSPTVFRPAFIYQDNSVYILDIIEQNNLENVMIICLDEFTYDSALIQVLDSEKVSTIVLFDPSRHRRLDREIKSLNKTYVRLDDLFIPERNNSAYLDMPPHKFSEEHIFFSDDHYSGYSDFTLLPMSYQTGGWTPRAVVIHWSYLDRNKEIWVRHFTSETNQTTSNVQGKFAEAARKIYQAHNNNELSENSALYEMLGYYNEEKYPGLGVVKKISIKNHILINGEYLRSR